MIPSIGRIVHYTLNEYDAKGINGRRSDARMHRSKCNEEGGYQEGIPTGNNVKEGDVFPAMLTKVWSDTPEHGTACNIQVFLDGDDAYWATSRTQVDGLETAGRWFEPPRVG